MARSILVIVLIFLSRVALAQESYRLNINRINLPFDNKGVLANVSMFFIDRVIIPSGFIL